MREFNAVLTTLWLSAGFGNIFMFFSVMADYTVCFPCALRTMKSSVVRSCDKMAMERVSDVLQKESQIERRKPRAHFPFGNQPVQTLEHTEKAAGRSTYA